MAKIDLPAADTAGSAFSRANADRAIYASIDWQHLSHELRTPLHAILGNAELLLDGSAGPLSAQARACLGEVQSAGHQLLRQVQLLLAWSELSVSRPKLAECPVEVITLVGEALAAENSGAVQVEPHDARFVVWGDRSWLQILVAEIIALNGARAAAPRVQFYSGAGRGALRFAWPGFCAARTGALQIALIEAIARLQGADVALHPDGLSLLWPLHQPVGTEAVASTHSPSGRSRDASYQARATPSSSGPDE